MLIPENRTITTARLLLRPFRADDAPEVERFCNTEEISRGTMLPYPYPAGAAASWIATHAEDFELERGFVFAITDRADGRLYGCISLTNHSAHKNGELGYWIGTEYWGRGYATEAADAMIRWAFARGYHRVYGRHFGSNPASGRVMQKLGMTYEGTQKEHFFKNGRYEDLVLYGLVRRE